MLSEYLKTLKNQQNLTNAQIAQMSGVSESTISRLFKGEAKNVDFSTVVDVVRALGGSIDKACGIIAASQTCTDDTQNAAMQDKIMAAYTKAIREDVISIYTERLETEKKHYEQLIAEKDAVQKQRIDNLMGIIDTRAKTINRLFLALGIAAAVAIVLLIFIVFFPTNSILNM